MVARPARDANAATLAYEDFKREHLNTQQLCQPEGITFIPLIAEADGGGWDGDPKRTRYSMSLPNSRLQ